MKITILMGSPNRNGSTSLLVNEFVRGAEEAGHTCEVIDVCHANMYEKPPEASAPSRRPGMGVDD